MKSLSNLEEYFVHRQLKEYDSYCLQYENFGSTSHYYLTTTTTTCLCSLNIIESDKKQSASQIRLWFKSWPTNSKTREIMIFSPDWLVQWY
jgi:hypothetical protein